MFILDLFTTGSSFFVPVAGFICRLCNKFYHFESSALHTHCKSVKHFEKFKVGFVLLHSPCFLSHIYSTGSHWFDSLYAFSRQRYKELLCQKGDTASSTEPLQAADSLQPTDGNPDGMNTDSMPPVFTLTRPEETQLQEDQAEPDQTSQDLCTTSVANTGSTDPDLPCTEEETPSQASAAPQSPAGLPAGSRDELEPEDVTEDVNEEVEKEALAVPGKNGDTRKAKSTPRRKSGRATNRR